MNSKWQNNKGRSMDKDISVTFKNSKHSIQSFLYSLLFLLNEFIEDFTRNSIYTWISIFTTDLRNAEPFRKPFCKLNSSSGNLLNYHDRDGKGEIKWNLLFYDIPGDGDGWNALFNMCCAFTTTGHGVRENKTGRQTKL